MATRQSGRGSRPAAGDRLLRVQAEIRDSVEHERIKRYAREYKQITDMEEALANLSRFACEPVDYVSALARKQWTEPAIPDFSYLLDEARMKVANKYNTSIIIELVAGLFFVILSLIFRDSFIAFAGIGGLAACALILNRDLQNRRIESERALAAARTAIDARLKEIRETVDKARSAFEEAENLRIERIESLLRADPKAIFERMEEVLQNCRLPFYMRCSIDFYDMEPFITLHLPGHNIIPNQIVSFSPTGILDYEDKTAFEINRQYTEALAGTAITIALLLYAYLPPLDLLHIRGIFDRWEDSECYYSFRLTRQTALEIVEAPTAIEAFRHAGANFEIGASGTFVPLEHPMLPGWWSAAPREQIMSMKVTCPSKFA